MTVDRCAQCGRAINTSGATWLPTTEAELCAQCLTGHEPGWLDYGPGEPPRFTRFQLVGLATIWSVGGGAVAWTIASMTEDDVAVWVLLAVATVIVGVMWALEYRRVHTRR